MTAIQQFWLVETPTVLTSTPYPVKVTDVSQLSFSSVITGGSVFSPIIKDDLELRGAVTLLSGSITSTASVLQQTETSQLSFNSTITSGSVVVTAITLSQVDGEVTHNSVLTGGSVVVTAVTLTQIETNGLTGSVSISSGSKT